jgi:hypothetical protein
MEASNACPKIIIECNSGKDCCNSPFGFSARIEGIRPIDKPTYKWLVSGGKIISGQGTSAIKVDSTESKGGTVTGVLEVDGVELGCDVSASVSSEICEPPQIIEIDAYGKISFTKEKSRLDRFANELKEISGAKAYLIAYNNNRERAEQAKQYLVTEQKIEASQIAILEGGGNQEFSMQLYLVPKGAEPPKPIEPEPSKQ